MYKSRVIFIKIGAKPACSKAAGTAANVKIGIKTDLLTFFVFKIFKAVKIAVLQELNAIQYFLLTNFAKSFSNKDT